MCILSSASHRKRQKVEQESWDKHRSDRMSAYMDTLYMKENSWCVVCADLVETPLMCKDCSVMSLYCHPCYHRVHQVLPYHSPFIWQVNLSCFFLI